ncbi:MAG: hypothetical protein ACOYMD_05340 [Paludibacter sp.]
MKPEFSISIPIPSLLIFIFFAITLSSCVPSYNLANSGIDPIVFSKPVYRDTATVNDYIGGKFTHSYDSVYFNPNESNSFGQVYWFRTRSEKDYCYSYGGFGYLGNYNVAAIESLKGKKNYYGVGVSGDLCLNIDLDFADLRVLGVKGALFYEDGDYQHFKKQVNKDSLAISVTDKVGINLASYTGFDIKLRKSSFGLYFTTGITTGFNSRFMMFNYSAIANYQTDRMTFFVQKSSTSSGLFYYGSDYSVGFNYRIK